MLSFDQASNAELLSSIAGPGPAQLLMARFGGLAPIARASVDELQQLKGVGKAKASAIRSAFLLAQRLSQESYREAPLCDTPERVADLLREPNRLYTVEHFQVVCLNTRRRLISVENIAQGILDQVLVHAREVFSVAIAKKSSAIILAHNHPSGIAEPSEADIRVTRELIRAGQLLKIEVLDHVILGQRTADRPRDYCSLRELGHFFSAH
jgi:DNA repair protein RadC